MTPGQIASFKAACAEYSLTGTYVSTAPFGVPYSCQTGPYTAEQLDGEDCAKCGRTFQPGEASYPLKRIAEWQLFAHVLCAKKVPS